MRGHFQHDERSALATLLFVLGTALKRDQLRIAKECVVNGDEQDERGRVEGDVGDDGDIGGVGDTLKGGRRDLGLGAREEGGRRSGRAMRTPVPKRREGARR